MKSLKGRLRRGFKAIYPWLNTTFEVWLLVSNVAYLFDHTPFYQPWLAWVGVDLRRLGMEDFVCIVFVASNFALNLALSSATSQPCCPTPSVEKRKGLLAQIRRLILSSPQLLFDSLRLLLPTAVFFIKFLEWWYSPGSPARSLMKSPLGPAVPPPRMLLPHPKGIPIDSAKYGQCPLCHGPINNAYGVTVWICFLLSLRLRACRRAWEMSRHALACEDLATKEGYGVILRDELLYYIIHPV
jgi:hypothetical protein